MLYLGVDLGTSSMKVLLVDQTGKVCKTASRSYPLEFPQPGWSLPQCQVMNSKKGKKITPLH